MRRSIFFALLVMIGLLITVKAIHAYEEAVIEGEVVEGVQGLIVAEGAEEKEDARKVKGTEEAERAKEAKNIEDAEKDEGIEGAKGVVATSAIVQGLGDERGEPCGICDDCHDEAGSCEKLLGRMSSDMCVSCDELQGGVCEECTIKEYISCEKCLECDYCRICEECGMCIDCTNCEHCYQWEECLKCEGCETGFVYEEWQLPEIIAGEPDGANSYYRRIPEVNISHQLENISVHYRFTNGQGESIEGIVSETDHTVAGDFRQGENILEVWVELPDRTWHEDRVFKLDSLNPEEPRLIFNQQSVHEKVYIKDSVRVTFESIDEGSGVYGYFYKVGNQEEVFIIGEIGEVLIVDEFAGAIEVTAIDYAGNKSEATVSPTIIIDKKQPIINISSTNALGRWSHNAVPIEVKIEEWGISSGINSIRILLDNEVILRREFSRDEKVYLFRETILVEKNSTGGLGLNLRVEARDNVGNEAAVNQSLLIDTKDPTIEFMDVLDHMIIGGDRIIEIELEDVNLLSYYQVNIFHSTFEGDENESILQGEINSTSRRVSINLESEGLFVIEATVSDISGRETEATLNVILDKTSPIIQYVEQLNGKHIPYFQWNYQSEELIYDHLDFRYDMELNNSRYVRGTLIGTEGDYVFQVYALDEAGNESNAYAGFIIDNTPPKIHFYNVDNEESYENEIMLGIAVTEHGERIRKVEVNGEIANIERDSQLVQLRFDRIDDYTITVEADDLAGNVNIEDISFSLDMNDDGLDSADKNERVEPGRQVEQIIKKVGAILPDEEFNVIEGRPLMKVLIGVCLLLVAGGVGYKVYKKKSRGKRVSRTVGD